MKTQIRNTMATVLAVSMLLPLAGCKKGKTAGSKKTVSKNDPYFNAEINTIQMNIDTDKKVEDQYFGQFYFVGDKLVSTYSLNYVMPKAVEEELEELYDCYEEPSIEKIERANEIWNEYNDSGIAVFDMQGKQIANIENGDSEEIVSMCADQDNNIVMLVNSWETEEDDTSDWEEGDFDCPDCPAWGYGMSLSLVTYSVDGEQLSKKPITANDEESEALSNYGVEEMILLEEGSFLFISWGDFFKVSPDGKVVNHLSLDDFGSIMQLDGKLYLRTSDYTEETSKSFLQEIDIDSFKLTGEKKQFTDDYSMYGTTNCNGKCYSIGTNGINEWNPLKDKRETFMDWDSTDLNYSLLLQGGKFNILSDDELFVTYTEYKEVDEATCNYEVTDYVAHLTRASENPHAGKTYIQLGACGSMSDDFINYIVEYNTDPNNQARLRLHDYSADVSSDTGADMLKELSDKVYLELLSGSGPDILLNFSSFSQFNTEEVLVDLNQYIDGPTGLNRDEYFDNVFRAFENKGKMFQIPLCVDISGLLGNKELIGERTGWTYSEFNQIVESFPEDVSVFEDMVYEELLDLLLSHAMTNLIDYNKKEVFFDGDEFKQILQITKKYGLDKYPEYDWDIDYGGSIDIMPGGGEYVSPEDRLKEGMLALVQTSVYSLQTYANMTALGGGKTIYVGVPSPDGTGMSAQPMMTMAISASSQNKDAAWDFIRYFYMEESQYKYTTAMLSVPLNRKAFDRINDDAIEENKREYEEYKKWSQEFPDENEWWTIKLISEEDKKGFQTLMENISTVTNMDMAVLDIIHEEAAAYFNDKQSLDAVCNNIQNRTSNIVRER